MIKMTEYVAGFLFHYDNYRDLVALVEKKRPDWQKGKLNGVGGHVETGEVPLQAVRREFAEETGKLVLDWREFCILENPTQNGVVHFFRARSKEYELGSTTDEKVEWFPIERLPGNCMPNLYWLIPMAVVKYPRDARNWPYVIGEKGKLPQWI